MMKKNNRRVVLAVVLILVVCAATIGGTIAWLTDKSEPVSNTFSPSNIDIWMTETVNGKLESTEEGVINNDSFKMVPGMELDKDPNVVVDAGSEACWLFVKIEESDNFDDFMEYNVITGTNGWAALDGVAGVYYREVEDSDVDQSFAVLTGNKVKVLDTVDKGMMDELQNGTAEEPTLTFTAYAIQSENIADVEAAAIELGLKNKPAVEGA